MSRAKYAALLGAVSTLPAAVAMTVELSDELTDLAAFGGMVLLLGMFVVATIVAGLRARRGREGTTAAVLLAAVAFLAGSSIVFAVAAAVATDRFFDDIGVPAGVFVESLVGMWFVGMLIALLVAAVVGLVGRRA